MTKDNLTQLSLGQITLPKNYWNTVIHSMITFLGQSLMNLVDILFCRSLGADGTAIVGTGTTLWAWFMVVGIGMVMAFEYLIPNAVGEKNETRAHSFYYSGLILTVVISFISTAGLYAMTGLSHHLGINETILEGVKSFCIIQSWSYLPVFITPLFRVELQARGFPHESTLAFLIGNVINALLNYAWVLGHFGFPSYGTDGSAWASLVSRICIAAYLLIRTLQVRKNHPSPIRFAAIEHWKYQKEILKIGGPISFHMLFEMGAFILVSTLAAGLPTSQIAAHTIAITLASFTFMIPLGVSSAAALTISKAVGEQNQRLAVLLGRKSIQIGAIFAFMTSLIYFFGRSSIIELYTQDPMTADILFTILAIVSFFQFGDAMQVILTGCLRGFGESAYPAKVNFFGHWFVGIPIALVACFRFNMGVKGLWLGLCCGLCTVATALLLRWRRLANADAAVNV